MCEKNVLNSCSDDARYARYARLPGCPAARKYARLSSMPDCPELCPEICPAARKYVRLPGNMPGCPVCPAVRKYARLSGNMPGYPVCPAARLPGNMPGNMPGCPAARNYARLPGMPGCPELCPAARNYARKYARNVRLPGIGITATLGRPTPAFSGAAGRRLNRHGWWHATTTKNRAQPRGRASGVRCKAMLGRKINIE